MKLTLILALALGIAACSPTVSDVAICNGLKRPVADLRAALTAHPEAPQPVGEAGTVVVLKTEAGCGS